MAKSDISGFSEKIYRCKICGYEAKSGAGLTGHIQLAHGERASGKEELSKIGGEMAKISQSLDQWTHKIDPKAFEGIAAELRELNSHLRSLRASREVSYQPPAIQPRPTAIPLPQLPQLPPPPSPSDVVGGIAVGALVIVGVLAILGSLSGPNK